MPKKRPHPLFGTDGVRGRANQHPMTVEIALGLGRALGTLLVKKEHARPRVVIGKDTRLSCYIFENALIAGLCSMGADTLMVGPLPTPGVAFITRAYRATAGVVISASHNSFQDNGIKFFCSKGFKLDDILEKEIEGLVASGDFSAYLPPSAEIGKNFKLGDADGRYIEFVKSTFPRHLSLKNMTIALDCANGAAFRVAPLVFKELDAKVHVIGNEPDGLNINEKSGALHPEAVRQVVLEQKAHVGISLDGDADRIIMVDEKGQVHDGDTLLAICARDRLEKGLLQNNTVVMTVMSNLGVQRGLEALGIQVVNASVGDRYVIQEMQRHNAFLGGEPSGHLIYLDHNTTGDGIVGALQVLKIMIETGKSLSELAQSIQRYPQTLINVPVKEKRPMHEMPRFQQAIVEAEHALGSSGRLLVRYSGTENICRVMVEGQEASFIDKIARSLATVVETEMVKA